MCLKDKNGAPSMPHGTSGKPPIRRQQREGRPKSGELIQRLNQLFNLRQGRSKRGTPIRT